MRNQPSDGAFAFREAIRSTIEIDLGIEYTERRNMFYAHILPAPTSFNVNEKPSKFKKRFAIAFMVFGAYLLAVGFLTTDSSMGSSIATKIMRWATMGGGIACMVIGFLMAYLRR